MVCEDRELLLTSNVFRYRRADLILLTSSTQQHRRRTQPQRDMVLFLIALAYLIIGFSTYPPEKPHRWTQATV